MAEPQTILWDSWHTSEASILKESWGLASSLLLDTCSDIIKIHRVHLGKRCFTFGLEG